MGASQSAIAEHAKPTLSDEQQRVLTQSLVNLNTTDVHGVTISTVLLRCDIVSMTFQCNMKYDTNLTLHILY